MVIHNQAWTSVHVKVLFGNQFVGDISSLAFKKKAKVGFGTPLPVAHNIEHIERRPLSNLGDWHSLDDGRPIPIALPLSAGLFPGLSVAGDIVSGFSFTPRSAQGVEITRDRVRVGTPHREVAQFGFCHRSIRWNRRHVKKRQNSINLRSQPQYVNQPGV